MNKNQNIIKVMLNFFFISINKFLLKVFKKTQFFNSFSNYFKIMMKLTTDS